MNIGLVLYTIIIRPIELLFEFIFASVYINTLNIVLSIIVLSLTVNLLVLPLYYRADVIQKKENEKKKSINQWEKHIKKSFKGDEQFMMLQTYYRQNDYKPYRTINNVLPLLLEIPFFIAAYHFLSNLNTVEGISLWKISDLSAPDALLNISGNSINILPIIMTLINIISLEVYGSDNGVKNKIQMYVLAGAFLFILYKSPAILCIYWILNNIFSLFKNIVYKIVCYKKKKQNSDGEIKTIDLSVSKNDKGHILLFFLTAFFIILYAGAYIPSKIISSSPEDFIDKSFINNPSHYVLYNILIYFGIFVFWFGIVYYLSSQKYRYFFMKLIIILACIFVVDYLFMNDQGRMNKYFVYENYSFTSMFKIITNLIYIVGISVIIHFVVKKWSTFLFYPLIMALCVLTIAVVINIWNINNSYTTKKEIIESYNEDMEIHLSKEGKNVVVIMMDRMISQFIPYYVNENPELLNEFSGFTYYPNTVSLGSATITGSPGIYGGYEYIPQETNKRSDMFLKDKQNEALKVMPVLFHNNGFNVRVSDPTYANYDWIPDLSIYSEYPDIITSISIGRLNDNNENYNVAEMSKRNLFFNSMLNVSPSLFKDVIYRNGSYNNPNRNYGISYQTKVNKHMAYGISDVFYDSYNVLDKLDDLTVIEENDSNNFFMMSNDTTHELSLLQEPNYEPLMYIDNRWYDENHSVRKDVYGNEINFFEDRNDTRDSIRVDDYQMGMAAMMRFGEWMNYLKNEGVYDNTRIIIVSDHSADEYLDERFTYHLYYENGRKVSADLMRFQCTLLVKDFDSYDFIFDSEFMTNADVPSLACDCIIKDSINPFTGQKITSDYKNQNELQLNYTDNVFTETNNGYTFLPEHWFSVHDNIFDINNWKYLGYY